MPKPPLGDRIRAKLDELEVDHRVDDLVTKTEQAVAQGVARAGELAHEHRDEIDTALGRAADAVDRRMDGRHGARLGRLRDKLEQGVDRIAERRPDGE
jgi:hypothetical protein